MKIVDQYPDDPDHTLYGKAYDTGIAAGKAGAGRISNPYRRDNMDYEAWNRGYDRGVCDWYQMRYGRKRPAEEWRGGDLNCKHVPTDAMLCNDCGWVPRQFWTSHKSCGRCMETKGLGSAAAAPLLKREVKTACNLCGAVKE